MTSEQAKGYCAIRHREVTGMWPGDRRNRTKKALEGGREAVAKFTLPNGATYEFTVPVEPLDAAELLAKHGSHNQKDHAGKGGSGGLDPKVADSIIERTRANGGLSVNMVDGSEPPDGFMVARTKGVKPAVVDADEFYDSEKGPAALGSFLKDNKDNLTGGDYLGVWHDTNGGKVYLDVSQNVKDQARAERLGRERDQISIWDVSNMKEIPTGGTGEIAKADSVDQVAGSVEDDGRGDRRLRSGDLAEVQPEVSKHLQGKHDQKSHARGGAQRARRAEAIERGDTKRPLPRDADGRVINPDATGGYKAGIPETVVFKGETLTPEHSLWHHLEGNPKDGYTITAERAAVHKKIVEDATRGVPRSDDPTFYMLGGGPAAGKTTAVKSGLAGTPDEKSAVQINADDIKGSLPEYDRMRFSESDNDFFNAAAFAHEESSYLAKQVQKQAFENRQDVVLDGTGDSKYATLEKKVGQARDAGYKVNAVYATVPTGEAVRRSNLRALRPDERRFVPNDVVRGTHRDVSAVFPEAVRKGLFNDAKLIDTTERGNAVLIGETTGGRFQVRDQGRWNDFVAKGSE
jgi:predicted ABC-type ATPase